MNLVPRVFQQVRVVSVMVAAGCVAASVYGFVTHPTDELFYPWIAKWCHNPSRIIEDVQVYRIFTSVFLHGGVLHLVFNMVSFLPMACVLERFIGSTSFLYLIVLFIAGSGLLDVLLSALFAYNPMQPYSLPMHSCSAGFSGIIFGLLVIETHLTTAHSLSMFGLCHVPTKLYPWALLVVLQVMLPNVSFMGHLCGILMGYLFVYGQLNYFVLRSRHVRIIERCLPMTVLGVFGFEPVPPDDLPTVAPVAANHVDNVQETSQLAPQPQTMEIEGEEENRSSRKPWWSRISVIGSIFQRNQRYSLLSTQAEELSLIESDSELETPTGSGPFPLVAREGTSHAPPSGTFAKLKTALTPGKPGKNRCVNLTPVQGGGIYSQALEKLTEMGFKREPSIAALITSKGDLDKALQRLESQENSNNIEI